MKTPSKNTTMNIKCNPKFTNLRKKFEKYIQNAKNFKNTYTQQITQHKKFWFQNPKIMRDSLVNIDHSFNLTLDVFETYILTIHKNQHQELHNSCSSNSILYLLHFDMLVHFCKMLQMSQFGNDHNSAPYQSYHVN